MIWFLFYKFLTKDFDLKYIASCVVTAGLSLSSEKSNSC